MGDPRLLRVARPVAHLHDPTLREIVADMYETMHAANGVGLAAPQIGVDLRLMIFGFAANPRYPDEPPVPLTTLINPWLEVLGEETEEGWEGCLSVPGMRGLVPRAAHIRYGGALEDGTTVTREVRGFSRPGIPARIRPSRRRALSAADRGHDEIRLHRGAVPRQRSCPAGSRQTWSKCPDLVENDQGTRGINFIKLL